ncbi:Hypothetical predicted protein, partial [Paramuricea clavata]
KQQKEENKPKTQRKGSSIGLRRVANRCIGTRVEPLALANFQQTLGKTDLAEFIANCGYKAVDNALKVGWEIKEAPSDLERATKTCMEILEGCLGKECVAGCDKQWLYIAHNVLSRNDIPETEFREAVVSLLTKGRGEYRNILIKGSSYLWKNFLTKSAEFYLSHVHQPCYYQLCLGGYFSELLPL